MDTESKWEVNPAEVRGVTYRVWVDERGRWFAEFRDQTLVAATRDDLVAQLMTLTKRVQVRVEVPFEFLAWRGLFSERLERPVIMQGTATGIHSGTGHILARVPTRNGIGTTQLDRTGLLSGHMEPLTPEQREDWARLAVESRDAQAALTAFVNAHQIDLRKAVTDAIEAKREDHDEQHAHA